MTATSIAILVISAILMVMTIIWTLDRNKKREELKIRNTNAVNELRDEANLLIKFVNSRGGTQVEELETYDTIEELMIAQQNLSSFITGLKETPLAVGQEPLSSQAELSYDIVKVLAQMEENEVFVGEIVPIDKSIFDRLYSSPPEEFTEGTVTYTYLKGQPISGTKLELYTMLKETYPSMNNMPNFDTLEVKGVNKLTGGNEEVNFNSEIAVGEAERNVGYGGVNEYDFDFTSVIPEHAHVYKSLTKNEDINLTTHVGADKWAGKEDDEDVNYHIYHEDQIGKSDAGTLPTLVDFNSRHASKWTDTEMNVSDASVSVYYYVVAEI